MGCKEKREDRREEKMGKRMGEARKEEGDREKQIKVE
jgi:hypothetical protein